MKNMKTITFLADGKYSPVIQDAYPVGEKIEFCGHVLKVTRDSTCACKDCFFNEPWFDCRKVNCNRSEREDAESVRFIEEERIVDGEHVNN